MADKTNDQIQEILSRLRDELITICSSKKTGMLRYIITVEINTRSGGIGAKFLERQTFREGF